MTENNQQSSVAMAALIFGAAGFVAGVLLAPKSGRESREMIKEKAHQLKDRATTTGKELKDTAGRTVDRAKNAATESAEDAKQSLRRGKSTSSDSSTYNPAM